MDEETLARIVGMKRAGIKTADIAKRLGISETRVQRAAQRAGAYVRLDHKGARPKASACGRGNIRITETPDAT